MKIIISVNPCDWGLGPRVWGPGPQRDKGFLDVDHVADFVGNRRQVKIYDFVKIVKFLKFMTSSSTVDPTATAAGPHNRLPSRVSRHFPSPVGRDVKCHKNSMQRRCCRGATSPGGRVETRPHGFFILFKMKKTTFLHIVRNAS